MEPTNSSGLSYTLSRKKLPKYSQIAQQSVEPAGFGHSKEFWMVPAIQNSLEWLSSIITIRKESDSLPHASCIKLIFFTTFFFSFLNVGHKHHQEISILTYARNQNKGTYKAPSSAKQLTTYENNFLLS